MAGGDYHQQMERSCVLGVIGLGVALVVVVTLVALGISKFLELVP
jgi:hypothetical protein